MNLEQDLIKQSISYLNKTKDEFIISLNSLNFFNHNKKIFINVNKISFIRKIVNLKLNKPSNIDKIENVFISHFISDNQKYQTYDFYHDKIIEVVARYKKCLRIFINHTSQNIRQYKNENIENFFLIKSLFLLNHFHILLYFFSKFFYLKILGLFSNNQMNKFAFKNISFVDSITSSANYITSKKIVSLLKKTKAKNVFMPFEGHSWEKITIFLIKKNIPKIKIYYYQFNLNHRKMLFLEYLNNSATQPHYILCASKIVFDEIRYKKINIKSYLIGSNRLLKLKVKRKINNNNCLILPEGIDVEINFFINFIFKYCSLYSNLNFIFRLPPHLNKLKYQKSIKILPKNFTFTINSSLLEDINKCKFVIFRGTSAVFNAVYNGLIPIYLKKNKSDKIPFPVDENIDKYFYKISKHKELFELTNKMQDKFLNNEFKVDKYLKNNYFCKFNEKKLISILKLN